MVGWLWSTVQEQGALSSVTLCSDEMAVEHSTRARGPSLMWQPVNLTLDCSSTAATSDRGMAKVLAMVEAAVIKNHVTNAVKADTSVVSNATECFNYCEQSTLTKQPAAYRLMQAFRAVISLGVRC